MVRNRALSAHALAVVAALAEAGGEWRHGYDLVRSTGLKSGTLYPLLMRLEAQGFLEAQWQESVVRGPPPRHAYRLTASGMRLASGSPAMPAALPGRRQAI